MLANEISSAAVEWLVRSGQLIRVRQGVYRLPGSALTWKASLLGAILASSAGTVASHRAAARLWGMSANFAERVEITVPRGTRHRGGGVVVHASQIRDFTDFVGPIPVTSPERTLLELSRYAGDRLLRRIYEDAVIRKIVDPSRLQHCYRSLRARGRRRFGNWPELLPELELLGSGFQTRAEVRGFKVLTDAGLPAPISQYVVRLAGRTYEPDLAYPELKIAIELDGGLVHDVARRASDRRRDRHFHLAGWVVLRFPNDFDAIELVADVSKALSQRAA